MTAHRPQILILAGPPGAGKTTVARALAERSELSVCIEADWFWTTIATGFIAPWEPESDDQNRTVIRSTMAAASEMVRGGYDVVVEGIVGPWMLDIVVERFDENTVGVDYVVLRPSLGTCLDRAALRSTDVPRVPGHPPLSDEDTIRHMWQQFADLGDAERHVLDDQNGSATDIAELINSEQTSGRFALITPR